MPVVKWSAAVIRCQDPRYQASAMADGFAGAAPAEFPVERPVRFKLVVNLKAARALNVTLPTSVLLSANEIIE